jgi:hypothetical protein
MVSLSTWFRYAAHKFEYSISLSWKVRPLSFPSLPFLPPTYPRSIPACHSTQSKNEILCKRNLARINCVTSIFV